MDEYIKPLDAITRTARGGVNMGVDFEKLSKELLDHLDSVTDEELLQELIECGLQLEEE